MTQEEFDLHTQRSEATITAKVLADSEHPVTQSRLTTFELTYPRFIHSEFMTHRMISRNSASSRAIPMNKMIERIKNNPVFPLHWGKNQKGMQATEELTPEQKLIAADAWIEARDSAIMMAEIMESIGIHKQIGNRLVEPWMWITVIASATNLANLFALRCHPDAEPHFQNLAYKIHAAYTDSRPKRLNLGDWHLPLVRNDEDLGMHDAARVSAGRCARVSYLTHDGIRDPKADVDLYERLATSAPMHASPLEHPAKVYDPGWGTGDWGNFAPGWLQLRKMHANECVHIYPDRKPRPVL